MTGAVTVILWPRGHPEDTEDTPRMVERAGLLTGIVELLNYSTLVLPIYGLVTDRKLLISGQFHLGFLIIVDQQFSKCAPRPRSTSITGGLVRNANSQARPTESETLGGARQCVLTSPPGDSGACSGLSSTK